MKKIEVYTDGSCTNNGRPDSYGAFGYVILAEGELIKEFSQFEVGITNNQMELTGVSDALQFLLDSGLVGNEVIIYSDSQYVVKGMNEWSKNWKRNSWKKGLSPIPNAEYWKFLDKIAGKFPNLTFTWVRGHSDNEWNNYVDELCTTEVERNGGVSFESIKYK